MRRLISIALLTLAAPFTMAQEDFRDAVILEAVAYRENTGAMIMPGAFPTVANTHGRNSAANLIIGQTVKAALGGRGNRKLVVQIPDGGEIRADVVRREVAPND
jgi:hypothetical protein